MCLLYSLPKEKQIQWNKMLATISLWSRPTVQVVKSTQVSYKCLKKCTTWINVLNFHATEVQNPLIQIPDKLLLNLWDILSFQAAGIFVNWKKPQCWEKSIAVLWKWTRSKLHFCWWVTKTALWGLVYNNNIYIFFS